MNLRILTTVEELRQVEDLQARIWGASDREVIPYHQLLVCAHNGGLVLGALDGPHLVGFAYAFPAVREGQLVLYSHLAGVDSAYRRRGLGGAMKLEQAAWARTHGYDRIVWTYDPLQAANAHLNLRWLGAVANRYHPDYYGAIDDDINRGLPSDRLEVEWLYDRPRPRPDPGWEGAATLLACREGRPEVDQEAAGAAVCIEIPVELPREQIQAWREATAASFISCFQAGLAAVDFRLVGGIGRYLLVQGAENPDPAEAALLRR
ncbi:MAG: GNAT family N-acetyltransferase [Armatimonadetes bacterium]|nr:GNAT family N-acetyltransferase [Armatimonadota bacterium]